MSEKLFVRAALLSLVAALALGVPRCYYEFKATEALRSMMLPGDLVQLKDDIVVHEASWIYFDEYGNQKVAAGRVECRLLKGTKVRVRKWIGQDGLTGVVSFTPVYKPDDSPVCKEEITFRVHREMLEPATYSASL